MTSILNALPCCNICFCKVNICEILIKRVMDLEGSALSDDEIMTTAKEMGLLLYQKRTKSDPPPFPMHEDTIKGIL